MDKFETVFAPLYGPDDKRWPAFKYLAEQLLELNRPVVIVETGSTRNPSNFGGDGNASLLWNWFAKETRGAAISIDIDPHASEVTKKLCANTKVLTCDSITALRGYLPGPIDLLFLDSFDYEVGHEISSMMHHVGELAAIWDRLPLGCLIAVDDCVAEKSGKHVLVRHLLQALGIRPELQGYITVWRKA